MQVKRSIRNLFSRKRKNQNQQKPAEGSTSSTPAPTVTTTGEPTQTGIYQTILPQNLPDQLIILSKSETAPPPQPSNAGSPSESEVPTRSSEPQFPAPPNSAADVNPKPEAVPSTAQTLTSDTAPPSDKTGEPGMSATSGPLDDQMIHEYSHVGTDEASAPVAERAEAAEAATAVEGNALKA